MSAILCGLYCMYKASKPKNAGELATIREAAPEGAKRPECSGKIGGNVRTLCQVLCFSIKIPALSLQTAEGQGRGTRRLRDEARNSLTGLCRATAKCSLPPPQSDSRF